MVGTAGHVDHGKSTLVLALTGRDPDRFAEEKRRGLTIDLGFAWTRLPSGREVGFVDVPGHDRFVHNMLAGVGQLDAAVFVVAANEGWMPQTEEHLRILELLGGDSGVVALTKTDLVDAEIVELARLEVEEHLAGTGLADAAIVDVAAPDGRGLDDLATALDAVLERRPRRADLGRPRLWIDRSFSLRGPGTVVTGTLAGGSLPRDAEVVILPSGARARLRSVQTHEQAREVAVPGTRTALNLAGASVEDAGRGDAVVLPGQWLATSVADVEVTVLAAATAPVGRRGAHLLHVGTAEVEVTVHPVEAAIGPGSTGLARIRFQRPLPLQPGDRFVLRDTGRSTTVGGGRVLDVSPPRRGLLARAPRLEIRRAALETGDRAAMLSARLDEGPARIDRLAAELGLTDAEVRDGPVLVLGPVVVTPERLEHAATALEAALARHHREHHLDAGMPRPDAVAALGLPAPALDRLIDAGRVVAIGPRVAMPGHAVTLDPDETAAVDEALATLRAAGAAPPEAASLGLPRRLFEALSRERRIETVGPFAYDAGVFRDVATVVRTAAGEPGGLTVSRMREILGITRKHAVPLAEALDQRRITVRRGDARFPGPIEP